MQLEGIHHISAITGDAARNLDFYTRVIGLRLVAKTVNQDDPSVYHLFYADEQGRPGAELTFFEYPHANPGRAGAGMVHTIVWRLGTSTALDFWAQRLGEEGIAVERNADGIVFSDFEGLRHEFRTSDSPDTPLQAEHPDIPVEFAPEGFDGVRAYSRVPQASAALSEHVLGARPVAGADATWELRGEVRGATISYDKAPSPRGIPSAGTVHHVAWGTSAIEHPRWAQRINAAGIHSSGIVYRHYFHSVYFREPSGVLFEIADDAPGFTVDVPLDRLGSVIILPPRLEPHRELIEQNLTALPDPRAAWEASTR